MQIAPTRNIKINGEVCTEVDGAKWESLVRTLAYCAAGIPLKDDK